MIIEGKTKQVYDLPQLPGHCILINKDRITAGDGVKAHDLAGKAAISNQTNGKVFGILNAAGNLNFEHYAQNNNFNIFAKIWSQEYERPMLSRHRIMHSFQRNAKWFQSNGSLDDWLPVRFWNGMSAYRRVTDSHRQSMKHSSKTMRIMIHNGATNKLYRLDLFSMEWKSVSKIEFLVFCLLVWRFCAASYAFVCNHDFHGDILEMDFFFRLNVEHKYFAQFIQNKKKCFVFWFICVSSITTIIIELRSWNLLFSNISNPKNGNVQFHIIKISSWGLTRLRSIRCFSFDYLCFRLSP